MWTLQSLCLCSTHPPHKRQPFGPWVDPRCALGEHSPHSEGKTGVKICTVPGKGPGAIWAGISGVLDMRVRSRRGPVGSRSCVPLGLQIPQPLLTEILEAVNFQVHHLPPSDFKSKPQAMKGLCWPLVVTKNNTTKLCPFSQDACMGFGSRKQTRALWTVEIWGPRYPSGCCWPRGRVGFRGTSLWPRDWQSWWRWEWGPLKLEDESSLRSWWEIHV